ncbi:hybrid sensor histidine kinase/response regulator [Caballeronia ptereochthonis]|uniref:histidine kinase n=1 Tax=Caballeronia ptereochthonis TaxID=1777144 RepID=A0A158D645_9BURK|nr:hybrid sensor histidine kinase/response regulator [Caballeronia ptereochthonis]SAK90112.1 periplasmic sensor hybrid histidine kinase [Caballeronia ptereochthonis]
MTLQREESDAEPVAELRQEEPPFPVVPERNFAAQRMTLYALLVAAIVLPCVYVAVIAWTDYHARVADASDLVARNARVAEEHALKVFDLNVTLNERIVDLLDGLDADAIRRDGAVIHQRLKTISGTYQQVAAASVFGPDGRLLATSRTYPTPDVSVANREDFGGMRAGRQMEQISRVMTSRVAGDQVFNTAVARRTPAGKFDGMVSIALRPSYFADFYRELIGDNPSVSLGLSREDGEVLAWYPPRPPGRMSLAASSPLRDMYRAGRRSGVVKMVSGLDDQVKIVAFRRVGTYPIYVSSGYPIATIWSAWYEHLSVLALSIFAPCIVLWGVIGQSLRRLATEEEAWERWQAEASMRRSIESAYRQARKMEALGNLVGSVAHDFNNLLMIVSTNVQIARRRGAPGLDRELSAMERALKSGQSLTRQLLGVARKQPLRSETIAIGKWVPAGRELLRASLGAKVALNVEVAPDVWTIRVDPAELELALINVAVNARDAMPNGGTFTVRADNVRFRHEDGFPITGDFVQISLEDTGFGMNSEILGRAFEPLFTTKPKGMGTGLGLPQVFAFCERAGGLATIDSAIGAGTAVRLYLPRAAAAGTPGAVVREEHTAGKEAEGLRVLLVEDNEEVAAGTEALLTMMGHQVTYAFNADTAVTLLEAARAGAPADFPFDVVLSDIHMPGQLNGIDLAEMLQRFEPRIPVILVTGYAEELDRARQVGARVLSKPFDIALLDSLLRAIRERVQDANATAPDERAARSADR